jgi:hypothetical protein
LAQWKENVTQRDGVTTLAGGKTALGRRKRGDGAS